MKKNVRTIKPDCQLANELLYILLWVEIFHCNALSTPKLINVKQKYFRISRNYTKIISKLNYKKTIEITIIFQKAKKSIKYWNYLTKWIKELLE